jgi:uncharacterized protein (DUF697 family)
MATDEQKQKASKIIHEAVRTSAIVSGGLSQIPGASITPLLLVSTKLVVDLGNIFDKNIDQEEAKAISKMFTDTNLNVFTNNVTMALMGFIPAFGNLANASISATYTEQFGWWCFNYFDEKAGQ